MATLIAALLLLLAPFGFAQGRPVEGPASSIAVRLHHVHAVVLDPAVAMREAAGRVDGSVRMILQGHGPGVRKDGQYIVFDRDGAAASATPACEASIRAAVAWLTASGATIDDREFSLAPALQSATCRTIAFAAERPGDIVERLRASGVEPVEARGDESRYRLASGLAVEILEDRDRPDTHWCPMHPDVRAPRPGACSLCRMDLVPIPPPQVGEYGLDVTIEPASDRQLRLRFVVTEPASGRHVPEFVEVHERLFHLFIVSIDLERFEHVHPERQSDGSFALMQALAPGEYMLIADVVPRGGTPQMLQRTIVTPGYAGPLFSAQPRLAPTSLERRVEDLLVRLATPVLTELRSAPLTFDIVEAASGRPATGLEPYLGAPAHLLVVDDALQLSVHAHPEQQTEPAASGGINFDVRFPKAGLYKMWFQFQRSGKVHTVPFVVTVAPL